MIKILFVCHGNICRSPMAEFVMKDMVEKRGISDLFYIASAATSTEEIGNGVHSGTKKVLSSLGIRTEGKKAVQIREEDYDQYDYILGMDYRNIMNMHRIMGEDRDDKVRKLLEFAGRDEDIADPWYTGEFDLTYSDVLDGCTGLLEYILENDTKIYEA